MKIFWSWQSDHPGNISRHLVRKALELAATKLNEDMAVEEPEREVTIDHDRKGVPGSPDLVATILEKIRNSNVFVADVTPVGSTPGDPPKKLINSNVAIELGYALHTIGDRRLIMVMNTAFGVQADLPFDLKHKSGPIFYNLSPTASKEQIETEKKQLASKLKVALREISAAHKPQSENHARIPHVDADPSRYFKVEDLIINLEGDGIFEDGRKLFGPIGPLVFLRVTPTQVARKLTFNEAKKTLEKSQVRPFGHDCKNMSVDVNPWGAISYEIKPGEDKVLAATQLHRNCEIWGFDSYLPCPTHKPKKGGPPGIWAKNLEEAFQFNLANYVKLLADHIGIPGPYQVIAGLSGVAEHILAVPSNYGITRLGPFLEEPLIIELKLSSIETEAVNAALLKIYRGIFDSVGAQRPSQFRGFPATTTQTNS